jgi:hypothetical protein
MTCNQFDLTVYLFITKLEEKTKKKMNVVIKNEINYSYCIIYSFKICCNTNKYNNKTTKTTK